MRVAVEFRDESQGFEVAAGRLIDAWDGPPGCPRWTSGPRSPPPWSNPDFPPLGRAVVPGDRVAIPLDADMPGAARRAGSPLLDPDGGRDRCLLHPRPDPGPAGPT